MISLLIFPKNIEEIFNSKIYHKGTIFALPQIYTLSKCYKLLDNNKEYMILFLDADLILFIFIH